MSELQNLIIELEQKAYKIKNSRIVAGFDGFIDQVTCVVDEREDLKNYKAVTSMKKFGEMIISASNRSSLREIVIESADIGGCAVNLGDGVISLGSSLDFYGSLGKPMHSAFKTFASKCRLCVPLDCDPGLTTAK